MQLLWIVKPNEYFINYSYINDFVLALSTKKIPSNDDASYFFIF